MDLFGKALLIAALVLLILFALAAAVGAVFFKMVLVREKHPGDPMDKSHVTPEELERWRSAVREGNAWVASHKTQAVEISSFDGLRLSGLLVPAEGGMAASRKFLLAIHGYRSGPMREYYYMLPFYHSLGYHVLMPDDRAHGKSEGKYIGFGWLDRLDCIAWANYIIDTYGPDCEIVMQGVSMGAATVMNAAGESLPPQVKGIIEDCGFSTARGVFAHEAKLRYHLPAWPLIPAASMVCRLAAGYRFSQDEPVRQIQRARVPFLFIHGSRDDFVPTPMVHEVYDACPTRKTKLIVEGAAHAMAYLEDREGYEKAVRTFLESVTTQPAPQNSMI